MMIIFMAMRAPMSFLALTAMIGFMAAAAATPMTAGRVMTASVTAPLQPVFMSRLAQHYRAFL